jgi:cytidylate kinase
MVVCPNAEVKVFLTADPEERARRRTDERPGLGADALATDLRLRDRSDAKQLEAAPDAERIDTTHLGIEDVVARIEALAAARAER